MDGTSVHVDQDTAAIAPHAERLAAALRALIDASPLRGLGPIEMARVLGVDRTLASRLLTALRAQDTMEALSAMPGTSPLRQFIRAAREAGAARAPATRAEQALHEFEQVLLRHFGNRTRLDAALSDAVPAARRRQQETARQSVYRGMSLVRGVSIDLVCITWVVHPSHEEPGRIDTRVVAGYVGVRRLRGSAEVRLVGKHAHPARCGGLVREFCRPTDLSITTATRGDATVYDVRTRSIRQEDAADVFLSEMLVGAPADPGREGVHGYGGAVVLPYKKMVLNVLVHPAVWPGCSFGAHSYDVVMGGMMSGADPRLRGEELALDAPVTQSPATPAVLREFGVPRYPELLAHVAGPVEGYRLFSCSVSYPLYGSQVVLIYEPPAPR